MRADGSGMQKLSGSLDRDVGDLTWARDNAAVYFSAQDRGTSNVFAASLAGQVRPLTTGQHVLSLGSISRTGIAAAVRSAATEPADVVRFALASPQQVTQAHQRQRRHPREQEAGVDRGAVAAVHEWRPGAGVAGQAPQLRSVEEVADDHGDPRRAARDVQRGLQLHVPELRRQRLRGAVHQPARLHRLRQRLRQRDQQALSRRGLRGPDGGRGHRGRARLRGPAPHVRGRVQRRRRAVELGHRPHQPVRRCRGALPGDELDLVRRQLPTCRSSAMPGSTSRTGKIPSHGSSSRR